MCRIIRTLNATLAAALSAGMLIVGSGGTASAAPADLDVVPRPDCPLSLEERAERHNERDAWRAERDQRHAARGGARDRSREQPAEDCPRSEEERAQRWQDRDEHRASRREARAQREATRPDGVGSTSRTFRDGATPSIRFEGGFARAAGQDLTTD